MNTDFKVYGMKLQPGAAAEDADVFEFCKNENVVGVGWGGIESKQYDTAEEVHQAYLEKKKRRSKDGKDTEEILSDDRLKAPLRYILKEINPGDFIWVNEQNEYALCKVTGDWEVAHNLSSERFQEFERHDIFNFRPVDWVSIPYQFVPGYIRRQFAGRFGTMRRIDVSEESKPVLEALHSQDEIKTTGSVDRKRIAAKLAESDTDRVFSILGSEETEDIVISYLQAEGWRVIKSSTSSGQATIECEMLREEDGESVSGYVQVKTGSAGADPESYREYANAGRMIFFVESGISVASYEGMQAIQPATIHEYMVSDYNYLTNETLVKLDFLL